MKNKTNFLTSVTVLFTLSVAHAQNTTSVALYTDYQQYFSSINLAPPGSSSALKTAQALQDSAAALTDEASPEGTSIKTLPASLKALSDEDIYQKRKNSVFIIGKLKEKDSTGAISFDLTGTAFTLTADGICVTNYHVLKNIIHKDTIQAVKDSVWFILGAGKQAYFIDKIIAYSQNNDLAVFKVNTNGGQLDPIPLGKPAQVGAAVYCISHPTGYFYYFSKGIVARNVKISNEQAAAGYNPKGKPPIRMEITADYGVGSSGGPVLDKYGNLAGVISSTIPFNVNLDTGAGQVIQYQQMVIRHTIPVNALTELIGK